MWATRPGFLKCGFLTRTPRGRCVTQKAYQHLGLEYLGQQTLEM
jgi:Holliday junction DNA helicase RuvB